MNTTSTVDLARMPAGFASPGPATQVVFRGVLEALSRPGRPVELPVAACQSLAPPAGASPALAALALTLLDGEVSLWTAASFSDPLLRAWLSFHTGVGWAGRAAEARFVLARAADLDAALWNALGRGSDEQPQDGATLIVDVDAFDQGPALSLSGPGIESRQPLRVAGVAPEVWALRRQDQAAYPLGVDLLLCHGRTVVGLPRSTRVD